MSLVKLSGAIAAVVTFVLTVIDAYSSFVEQSDDGKVLTGRNGLLVWDAASNTYHFVSDKVIFSNSGNRPFVVLGISLSYAKGTANDLLFSPTVCPRTNGGNLTSDLELVVKPGEVAAVTPLFTNDKAKSLESEKIDLSSPSTTKPQLFLSCLTIRYSIPDSGEQKAFPIMKMELSPPPQFVNEPMENRWMVAIAAAQAESKSSKILIDRTRTTFSWMNELMHFVAGKIPGK